MHREKEIVKSKERETGGREGDREAGPRPYNTTNQLMVICNCRVAACYYRSKARNDAQIAVTVVVIVVVVVACADSNNVAAVQGGEGNTGFLLDPIFKYHQRRIQDFSEVDGNFLSFL